MNPNDYDQKETDDKSHSKQRVIATRKPGRPSPRFILATSEDSEEMQKTGEWIATTTPAPLQRWL